MPGTGPISRRSFLETSAATTAVGLVARQALGEPKFVPPSDKINVGFVGCGTQGLRQLMPALKHADVKITAVCDPNRKSDDYIGWSATELGNKVRAFLDDPSWGKGARGALAGREVGEEIVDRHYGASSGGGCATYADFREMLAQEKDLDAVYIMTPDHLHATVALAAMKAGKHVIVHKPLGNVLREARLVSAAARETGLATHMFCAAGSRRGCDLSEWIGNGAIGPVREVHNWSSRPVLAPGDDEPARRRSRSPRASTGTSGSGRCPIGPTAPTSPTPSSGAGTTSEPAPSGTWGTTPSTRSSRS